jgi:viroplasmin and RNaseH domain-containing protein
MMLSFHNDIKVKKKYLARVRRHSKLGNIVQNRRWQDGKGGAVGCTLEHYDDERYPIELGLPIWLARLEEEIFYNLPVDEAKRWPEKFLKAIPVGVDTEIVRHQLAVRRMDRLIKLQEELLVKSDGDLKSVIKKTIAAINMVKTCHEAEFNKTECSVTFERASSWASGAQQEAQTFQRVMLSAKVAKVGSEVKKHEELAVLWSAASAEMAAMATVWSAVRTPEEAAITQDAAAREQVWAVAAAARAEMAARTKKFEAAETAKLRAVAVWAAAAISVEKATTGSTEAATIAAESKTAAEATARIATARAKMTVLLATIEEAAARAEMAAWKQESKDLIELLSNLK